MALKDRTVPWTEREELALAMHRTNGLTRVEISEKLGRTQGAIDQHVRKLGLASAWRAPRRPHTAPIWEGKALDLGQHDERYVTKCLSQGGFASMTQTSDGRYVFGHAGKVWVQP